MDGQERWMDAIFIERLWRSPKYDCACLHPFETEGGTASFPIGRCRQIASMRDRQMPSPADRHHPQTKADQSSRKCDDDDGKM